MKKRGLIVGLVVLAGIMTGCGSSSSGNSSASASASASTSQQAESSEKITLNLAAAASLKNVFDDEIIPMFEEEHNNIDVSGVYDSSGKLQTQIENGLEADLFFSAAKKQMNALTDEGYMDENLTIDLLENKLVLIKNKESDTTVDSIENILNAETIAVGDPESVPAGQYAKEALENLGIYEDVIKKASLGSNVTEVLSWVENNSAEVGLVYSTDAASTENVEVISAVPSELLNSPVIYPVGVLKESKNKKEAELFLDFIQRDDVLKIFEQYGFSINE